MGAIDYTDLIIIGAGPYGLAAAVCARRRDIAFRIVGAPMSFWRSHMPSGMYLRTACDWQIGDSLDSYLRERGLPVTAPDPVARDFFSDYVISAIQCFELPLIESRVTKLVFDQGGFKCVLANADILCAKNVIVATGYYDYRFVPAEYRGLFPANQLSHTADTSEFVRFRGKRCLIIGGRQSAFEWAVLLKDFASEVHVAFRHGLPEFKRSNWSWVYPFIEHTRTSPGWYRNLADQEREEIRARFWKEGRFELEDWLMPGLADRRMKIWPNAKITASAPGLDGALNVTLNGTTRLAVDHIVAATGYQPDLSLLAFLRRGNVLGRLQRKNGFPVLDPFYQSTLPGLYFTGIHAVNDFGPFLFFVACSFASAEVMIDRIRENTGR